MRAKRLTLQQRQEIFKDLVMTSPPGSKGYQSWNVRLRGLMRCSSARKGR